MTFSLYQFAPKELDETLHVLDAAIDNHRRWFNKLHTAMLCEQEFPEDILHDQAHTRCQFGQWYYGPVSDAVRTFSEFAELEECHKNMHDQARHLANICMQNKKIEVHDYKSFLDSQHHLIDLLGKLHDILNEHQHCFDGLTGALNRKSLSLLLEQAFENTRRYNVTYSIAMLDVDHFKKVNDEYGHMVGDHVLKNICMFLKNTLRKSDSIGRYGGEEFLVLMPETDEKTAYQLMEKCRKDLSDEQILAGNVTIKVSVSIGVTQVLDDDNDAWQAVKRADFSLYEAKKSGRNQVLKSTK